MGFLGFLFGKKKKAISLEEANAHNEAFFEDNPTPKNSEDALMRKASSLMTSGEFAASAEIYRELAEKYPERRGLYLSQVGAAYYFLSEFETAISYYLQSRKEGGDEGMLDDNVWEASEEIYNQNGDLAAIQRYLELFPQGNYVKRARKMLG